MNADKRSPHTDALETLGTLHQYDEKRDAIHIAVIQVTAGEYLYGGQHIELKGDLNRAYTCEENKGLGIVDPFITASIPKGSKFWLVLYPRSIQSLRHVWSHPDLPDELDAPITTNIAVGLPPLSGEPTDLDAAAAADPNLENALLLVGDPMATARKLVADYASNVDVTVDWLMNSFDGEEYHYHPDGSEHGEGLGGPSDAVREAVALLTDVPESDLPNWHFTCSC